MPLGNDIVNLRSSDCGDRHNQPRFIQKVLTEKEQALYALFPDKKKIFWTFWSAKEAAFKYHQQLVPSARFSPKKCQVMAIKDKGNGTGMELTVQTPTELITVHTAYKNDTLHSYTVIETKGKTIVHTAYSEETDLSKAVRALALGLIREHYYTGAGISITGGQDRAPRAIADGKDLGLCLSFSHHQGALAVALCG